MDATPETRLPSPSRRRNDVYESCSHAISSLWLQNRLLRDFDRNSRQFISCPLVCGRRFTALMSLVDHIPLCERLSTGHYWCWVRQIETTIPVQCQCRPGRASDNIVKREEDCDGGPSFPSGVFQDRTQTIGTTFLSPSAPLAWTNQECLSPAGLRNDQEREDRHMNTARGPFHATQMGEGPDVPVLTRTPATGIHNIRLATQDLGFDTSNYEPRVFNKPWIDVSMAGGSGSGSPSGFGNDGSNLFPGTWTAVANTVPQTHHQLHSPQIPTSSSGSAMAAQNPTSYHTNTRPAPGYGGHGLEPSPLGANLRVSGGDQFSEDPNTASPRSRRRHPAGNHYNPVIPQDGILPSLKVCFYSLLPARDRSVDHPLLAQLQQAPPHNALVGSLSELGRVASNQPVKGTGALNKLCFAYLALAMARTIEDYLDVKLPGERTARMESEISNLLLHFPDSTGLSPAFMNSTHSFLDLFQVYLKQELLTACDLSCPCLLSPAASKAIISKIRAQFPSVHISDAEQTLNPMQCHRTIRALELDLLRLSPGKMPTTAAAAAAAASSSSPSSAAPASAAVPELSVDDYFDRYIPAVRKECGLYYCNHTPRAKYHVWVIRLIWRALGAQEDAPLRSATGAGAGGPGTLRRGSSVNMSTESLDEVTGMMYLSPRSPVGPPAVTVDRATSPAPMSGTRSSPVTPSVPGPAASQKEQGFACPERACPYVAVGSNAKKLLKRHKDALHNPDKQKLPCPYCEKNFTRKDNLKAHVMKKHTQEDGDDNMMEGMDEGE